MQMANPTVLHFDIFLPRLWTMKTGSRSNVELANMLSEEFVYQTIVLPMQSPFLTDLSHEKLMGLQPKTVVMDW